MKNSETILGFHLMFANFEIISTMVMLDNTIIAQVKNLMRALDY